MLLVVPFIVGSLKISMRNKLESEGRTNQLSVIGELVNEDNKGDSATSTIYPPIMFESLG